jgi:uncharacterized small protein (DUF1192 family)
MFIPDADIDVLAADMIKYFPADAADRAALRSNALSVLGYAEKSEKWLLVSAEIKRIQAGQIARHDGESHPATVVQGKSNIPLPSPRCPLQINDSHTPILIALVAWSELIWLLLLRA